MSRRRLDLELVARGLATSRSQAKELVEAGSVLVGGAPASNPARLVAADEPLRLLGPKPRFVGRGGEKLEAALSTWDIPVAQRRALDVGASTGGFTDCLLQRDAAEVTALDVGHGQLHERIRAHDRVTVVERTNIRHVSIADFGGRPFDVIVVDVSFISLRTIAPVILGDLAAAEADVVVLIKPQFEAGRQVVSKGQGVVTDPAVWLEVLSDVLSATSRLQATTMGVMKSPITGSDGNVEFLAWLRAHQPATATETANQGLDLRSLVGLDED